VETLTDLVRLLDATAEDRWRPGHPSTRPRTSAADRAHDATRPDDPTADAVCDEARIYFAWAWRAALHHVQWLAAQPRGIAREHCIWRSEADTAYHLATLDAAYAYWLGHGFVDAA
jgi:hypothetical protein